MQVDVFPECIEISSPGGLFGNVRVEGLGEIGTSSSRNARLAALLQETPDLATGHPVAENRGFGVSMMIERARRDNGAVPLFMTNLDQFRVVLPRGFPVAPELPGSPGRPADTTPLSGAQLAALVRARPDYDIDQALLRKLGLSSGNQAAAPPQLPGNGLGARVMAALRDVEDASREPRAARNSSRLLVQPEAV